MARVTRRFAATALRSSSSPPQIFHRSPSNTESAQDTNGIPTDEAHGQRLPRARSRTKEQSGGMGGMTPLQGSRSPPTKYVLLPSPSDKDRVGSKDHHTPLSLRPAELPMDLPDMEFLEGGVELSPSRDGALWQDESPAEGSSVAPVRMLHQLGQQELEELWPQDPAQSNALFLDYDGTLREFEARPEQAVPTPELMELLSRIDQMEDLVPHIISGRNQEFLEEHFGRLRRFTLIAEHGFMISPAFANRPRRKSDPEPAEDASESGERRWELWEQYGGNVRFFKDHENWKAIMRREICRLVKEVPGSHLEEKRSSLVWHYREVDNSLGDALAVRAVERLELLRDKEKIQDVKISHGHKVVEVSYRNVRKGLVMRRLCEEKALFGDPYGGVLVAGDDVSDETMFDESPHDFLTIKVGMGSTLARFRAHSPQQLREFLGKLTV